MRANTLVLMVLLTVVAVVKGDLIATLSDHLNWGGADLYSSITDETYLSDEFYKLDGYGTLFEDIVIYDGETRTDTASVENDPDFSEYAELISDGLDWWLYEIAYFDGGPALEGRFDRESVRLTFTDPDHSGPDLNGYEIESVVRTITVELDTPGSDPNGNGYWTDFSITGQFEIYGHPIPEPATIGLLILPLATLAGVRRRTRERSNE